MNIKSKLLNNKKINYVNKTDDTKISNKKIKENGKKLKNFPNIIRSLDASSYPEDEKFNTLTKQLTKRIEREKFCLNINNNTDFFDLNKSHLAGKLINWQFLVDIYRFLIKKFSIDKNSLGALDNQNEKYFPKEIDIKKAKNLGVIKQENEEMYEEFSKKYNENNRYLKKTDIIVILFLNISIYLEWIRNYWRRVWNRRKNR